MDTPSTPSRTTYETMQRLESEASTKSAALEVLTKKYNELDLAHRRTVSELEGQTNTVRQLRDDIEKKDKLAEVLSRELVSKKKQCDAAHDELATVKREVLRLQQVHRDLTTDIKHKSHVAVELTHRVETPSAQYMEMCFNLGFTPPSEILRSLHLDTAIRCGSHALTFKEMSALCEVLAMGCIVNTKHWVEYDTLDLRFDGDESYQLLEELIRGMPTLKSLTMHNITDVGMKHVVGALRAVNWISDLSLPEPRLSDAGVQLLVGVVAHRQALVSSGSAAASISPSSLSPKANFSPYSSERVGVATSQPQLLHIHELDLSGCVLCEETTVRCLSFDTLVRLTLRGHAALVTDQSIQLVLRACPSLSYLDVSGSTQLTSGFLQDLNAFGQRILELNIVGCVGITKLHVKHVAILHTTLDNATELVAPELIDMPQVAEHMCLLRLEAPKLTRLQLKDMSLTTREWALLAPLGTTLVTLSLVGCRLTGVSELIRMCRKLEYLDLNMSRGVVDADIAAWCPKLRHVDLTNSYYITDEAMRQLAGSCRNLQCLVLRRCSNITDSGLRHLVHPECCLEELNVLECGKVSLLGLDFVVANVPTLQTVHHESYRNRTTNNVQGGAGDDCESVARSDMAGVVSPSKRPAMISTQPSPIRAAM